MPDETNPKLVGDEAEAKAIVDYLREQLGPVHYVPDKTSPNQRTVVATGEEYKDDTRSE